MSDKDEGWDDLFDDPAPEPAHPPIVDTISWEDVALGTEPVETIDDLVKTGRLQRGIASEYATPPDSVGQPETGASETSDESDGLTLFGDHDQFHVAWQHWNGMPEFHMDDLAPESVLVVKFRTPEAREDFARLIGREIRKEEPRGIWYPKIEIAHFWDKRYRDETAEVPISADAPPALTEQDEPDEGTEDALDEALA